MASAAPATPTGNGVAALPAREILSRARTAIKQAKSFQVQGTLVDAGQRVDLDIKVKGADLGGPMAYGKARWDCSW